MKLRNKILGLVAFIVLIPALALASGQELSWQKLQGLLTLSASSITTGDYVPVYHAANGVVNKVDATQFQLISGSYSGAVAATTLSASSTVSGTGFSTYLASPPAVGGTAAAAGTFTNLTASTSLVSKGTNDLSPTFSTGITANPAELTAYGTCTVAAVNGGTCIPLVGVTGRTVHINFFDIIATGSAATCTGIKLEDTNGTPVVAATLAAATLTSGAHNIPLTATLGVGFGAGSGLTTGTGVQILVNGSACTTTTAFGYEISYSLQ